LDQNGIGIVGNQTTQAHKWLGILFRDQHRGVGFTVTIW